MRSTWIITQRELRERVWSKPFLLMAVFGPLLLLIGVYILLSIGGKEKQHWKVLIMDKNELFENKLMPQEDPKFSFDFINEFVDYDQFAELKQFADYDLSVWINEKIFSNKKVIVSYRELPSQEIQRKLIYYLERRMDEVMVEEFTELSISQFREIKQPLSVSFKNVYDPKNETSYVSGWVGFAFGAFIILFIFLFGMTILRSVANEKTNRVVEVVLSATTPQSLLAGKIIGVGLAALMQFLIWVVIVGVGLLIFRQTLFPDLLDPEMVVEQLAQKSTDQFQLGAAAFNSFVDLIYAQINFTVMLLYFVFFFIGGYLFYGSFFTAIGASMGSESDGQQYVIPISLLLLAALFSGYLAIYFPTSSWTSFFSFFPFTSPVVMMVKLGNGFPEGTVWQLFFSIFILYTTAVLVLFFAARIYKNGILQFGHRLKWRHLIRWLTHK